MTDRAQLTFAKDFCHTKFFQNKIVEIDAMKDDRKMQAGKMSCRHRQVQ